MILLKADCFRFCDWHFLKQPHVSHEQVPPMTMLKLNIEISKQTKLCYHILVGNRLNVVLLL